MHEWLNNLWYIHVIEYHSGRKRNKLDTYNNEDEISMLSDKCQSIPNGNILYDSIYRSICNLDMTKKYHGNAEQITGC